jgi:hypothetical protein
MGDRQQSVARLAKRFWAARQREHIKDLRIQALEAEARLLRIGLDQPPAPTPIPQAPPLMPPPPDGLVMGALITTATAEISRDCPDSECAGHLHRTAAHPSGVEWWLCDTCPRTHRQLTKGTRP